jgi:hypothetical protein
MEFEHINNYKRLHWLLSHETGKRSAKEQAAIDKYCYAQIKQVCDVLMYPNGCPILDEK